MLSIKRFLPSTLFGRSLLILITPVLLIQVISIYIFFDRHWSKMTERLAAGVAGETAVIAERIENNPTPKTIRQVSIAATQYLGLLVSYDKGAVLPPMTQYHKPHSLITQKLAHALHERIHRPFQMTVYMDERWVEMRIALKNGVLNVIAPQERLFSSTSYIFLLWMIFSSVILLSIAILFMRNQIRPIRRLAIAAARIGKGRDLPPRFKPEGAYEVRQAARAFIDMHDRIKRQRAQRAAMLAGVSHDLRTPLTRLKLQVAMLGPNPDTAAMKNDIADMERMLGGYLDFVRGEGGESSSRANIGEILERITHNLRRAGTAVEYESTGDLILSLRALAFERCLNNIIGNAHKFASAIWISARREEESIIITVDDNGPGIPEDKMDDVFKPFVRVDPSRNPGTGGIGLGLSIAQDIVHAHGGEITLSKSAHGGLCVTIHLPA